MSSTKEQIAYRLRELRELLRVTQEVMATRLDGITRSVLANCESGRQPPSRNLVESLVQVFDVNAFWLLFGEGQALREDVAAYQAWENSQRPRLVGDIEGEYTFETPAPTSPPSEPASYKEHATEAWLRYESERAEHKKHKPTQIEPRVDRDEFCSVPFFDVPVSAGAGRVSIDDGATHTIAYRRDYLNRRGLVASNLIELPIAGDSMSPELESGDTVLVDKSRTNVAGDGIYVLAIDGLLYCKRLQLLPGRMLRVVSINTAYSPYDVQLPDEDGGGTQIEIIGRVVRQGRDR